MTIEEYLRKRIEDLEEGPCNSSLVQGKVLAYREILSKLPSFEHEVTVREFKEFCKTHEQCSQCSVVDMCRFDCPRIWDVEEMERRMKYEEERRMKEALND